MARKTRERRSTRRILHVDGVVPTPGSKIESLPEIVLNFALDQREFGPRQLMVALAAYDGRFLGLLFTERTHPIDDAVEVCLLHAEVEGVLAGESAAAAVVLCDQHLDAAEPRPEVEAMFERAKSVAARHGVHLVDWIGCDDDIFCCARMRTFPPTSDPEWWDVPGE